MSELLETSNRYDRPFRPWPVKLLNLLDGALPVGGRRLDAARLIKAARTKAGLHEFADESFREPLERLVDAMRTEARLTPMGAIIQRTRMISALVNRLRIDEAFRAQPEIGDVELGPVVVIAGLQRTGTTMLHRLLAADPRARSLRAWEALNPAPFPGTPQQDRVAREREAKRAEKALAYLAPEFFAIHPVEADAPEEEVLLLELSFMSQAPEATMYVPSYAHWLEGQDMRPAYRYMRRVLQLLQHREPGEHWVLKTPNHLEHLDALLDVFPGAKIIQTHRDPRKTMGSFCSMVAHGRGVFSDHVDPREVARHWMKKNRRLVDRAMALRDEADASHFIDVAYADLISDPVDQLERIYGFAGIEFTQATRDAVAKARKRNTKNKYGKHVYRLADFGLTPESIEQNFAHYRERYAILPEQGTT